MKRQEETGRRIRMARSGAELSQSALAQAITDRGVPTSRTIVMLIEKGQRDVELGMLIAVAEITGVTVEWLIERTES